MSNARKPGALGCVALIALTLGVQACGSSSRSSSATTATATTATASTAKSSASANTTSTARSATAAPLPKASNGATVQVLGRGVPTPTSIAVDGATVFVGAAGTSEGTKQPGGLFALTKGQAKRVAGVPAVVFGVAWHMGSLYLTSGPKLLKLSGWNGTSFATSKTLYTGPQGFDGFNGIAFGPDGRIYAGVSLNDKDDHTKSSAPYGQSLVSLSPAGVDLKVVARGLREPFQLTFAGGGSKPYVSVLGQDNLGTADPPDYIVAAGQGQNYGFPTCNWSKPSACARYAKPLVLLPAHASPMGIGALGSTLYVALFGGTGHGPEVASIAATGGRVKPLLTGFVSSVVALTASAGSVYVGDLSGTVYSVRVSSNS